MHQSNQVIKEIANPRTNISTYNVVNQPKINIPNINANYNNNRSNSNSHHNNNNNFNQNQNNLINANQNNANSNMNDNFLDYMRNDRNNSNNKQNFNKNFERNKFVYEIFNLTFFMFLNSFTKKNYFYL